jgi:hypothetical protein
MMPKDPYFGDATTMLRRRYASADGALIEELPLSITTEGHPGNLTPQVGERDGGFVTAGFAGGGLTARVARYAVDGSLRWERLVDGRNIFNAASRAVLSSNGDVLARTSTGDDPNTQRQLLRLDGATGATIADMGICDDFTVTNADATGYWGIGPAGVARVEY